MDIKVNQEHGTGGVCRHDVFPLAEAGCFCQFAWVGGDGASPLFCKQEMESSGTLPYQVKADDTHQSLKLQLNYTLSPFVTLRTSAIGSCISNNYNPTETGLAICENFRWQNNKKIRFDLGITYFNTNSYDARVYIYEPSLLYS